MNKKAFNALPKSYKKMIEMAAGHQVMYNYAESEVTKFGAMDEMVEKHGVQIKRWPDDQIAAFEKAWLEVIKEESAKDPLFKRIADDYLAFRAKYKIWGDAQAVKPTYRQVRPARAGQVCKDRAQVPAGRLAQPGLANPLSVVPVVLLVLIGAGFAYVSGLNAEQREELLYKVQDSCRS